MRPPPLAAPTETHSTFSSEQHKTQTNRLLHKSLPYHTAMAAEVGWVWCAEEHTIQGQPQQHNSVLVQGHPELHESLNQSINQEAYFQALPLL